MISFVATTGPRGNMPFESGSWTVDNPADTAEPESERERANVGRTVIEPERALQLNVL